MPLKNQAGNILHFKNAGVFIYSKLKGDYGDG